MLSHQSSFLEHYLLIKVEGFKQQELISECLKKRITLRQIKIKNNIDMTLKIKSSDFSEFKALSKNKYRITIVKEGGYIPLLWVILNNKARICGIFIFVFILYFQTLFISEIRVDGYEVFTEKEVREVLKEGGLFEGCRNSLDIDKLKLFLYDKLDNVSFVGITVKGSMAEVKIVEGTINLEKVDKSSPCNIVADKEGYVYKIIPIEGIRALETNDFFNKGDVLISGVVPIKSTAYGQPESDKTERYVHAEGTVTAKIPYRFSYNQSLFETVKNETGRSFYALNIKLGDKSLYTGDFFNRYEVSSVKELKSYEWLRPFPIFISLEQVSELQLEVRKRTREEMETEVNKLVRGEIKEKLPENAQILNKSLYFGQEKNIIEVDVMIESLQEIGVEQEIVVGEQSNAGNEASDQ